MLCNVDITQKKYAPASFCTGVYMYSLVQLALSCYATGSMIGTRMRSVRPMLLLRHGPFSALCPSKEVAACLGSCQVFKDLLSRLQHKSTGFSIRGLS